MSSEQEAREFEWNAFADLMVACLIIPRSLDALVDYWKANINMLDWAKKVQPKVYEEIRLAFAERRKQLEGGQHG